MHIRKIYLEKKYALMYKTLLYINRNNRKVNEYKQTGLSMLRDRVENLPEDIAFRPRPWKASFCIKALDRLYIFISKNNLYKPENKKYDALFHEIGHWLHIQNLPPSETAEKIWEKVDKEKIARDISQRAARGKKGMDFVAEIFKFRIKGRKFNQEYIDLYEQLNGPKILDKNI